MSISRRGLLLGVLSAGVAPAIVSSSNIMRINTKLVIAEPYYKVPLLTKYTLNKKYSAFLQLIDHNDFPLERLILTNEFGQPMYSPPPTKNFGCSEVMLDKCYNDTFNMLTEQRRKLEQAILLSEKIQS